MQKNVCKQETCIGFGFTVHVTGWHKFLLTSREVLMMEIQVKFELDDQHSTENRRSYQNAMKIWTNSLSSMICN